jgi:hypothetical protein
LSFFNELKRRNVFRIGIAYSIVTWLIVQIAALAADPRYPIFLEKLGSLEAWKAMPKS